MKNKIFKLNTQANSYAEYNEDSNEKDPEFKVGDCVRKSNKNTFARRYTQNWSEEVSIISKTKNTVPWTSVDSDLNGKPITWSFYEKELQKRNQKEFRIENVIKKGDKLYVKWKDTIINLIVGLIKKTLNEAPSYKNEPILF